MDDAGGVVAVEPVVAAEATAIGQPAAGDGDVLARSATARSQGLEVLRTRAEGRSADNKHLLGRAINRTVEVDRVFVGRQIDREREDHVCRGIRIAGVGDQHVRIVWIDEVHDRFAFRRQAVRRGVAGKIGNAWLIGTDLEVDVGHAHAGSIVRKLDARLADTVGSDDRDIIDHFDLDIFKGDRIAVRSCLDHAVQQDLHAAFDIVGQIEVMMINLIEKNEVERAG